MQKTQQLDDGTYPSCCKTVKFQQSAWTVSNSSTMPVQLESDALVAESLADHSDLWLFVLAACLILW